MYVAKMEYAFLYLGNPEGYESISRNNAQICEA